MCRAPHLAFTLATAFPIAATAQIPANVLVVDADAPPGGNGLSWQTAFNDLQTAISATGATGRRELWVAAGTYHPIPPGGPCDAPFHINEIALYGGFAGNEMLRSQRNPAANTTRLDGTRQGTPQQLNYCGPAVRVTGGPLSVLDGVTVVGAPFSGQPNLSFGAPAIEITGSPVVEGCTISAWPYSDWGVVIDGQPSVTLRSCRLIGNSEAGTPIRTMGVVVLDQCSVTATTHHGQSGIDAEHLDVRTSQVSSYGDLAAGLSASHVIIHDSVLGLGAGLGARGIMADSAVIARSQVTTSHNVWDAASEFGVLIARESRFAGRLRIQSAASLLNCRLSGSPTDSTPLVQGSPSSSAEFRSCTLHIWPVGVRSAVAVTPNADWTFTNTIAWGNAAGPALRFPEGVTGLAAYSCIQGWTPAMGGEGNTAADPLLDSDGRISDTSSCIDAGLNAAMPPGTPHDLVGNCRIADGDANGSRTVDIGAVEYAACPANCDCSTAAPILNAADFSCFLQRFAAGDRWANCDQSTSVPTLNVADFTCFLQRFAAGCP